MTETDHAPNRKPLGPFHSASWHLPSCYLLAEAEELARARPILDRLYAPFHAATPPSARTAKSALTVRIHAANWGPLALSSLRYSKAIDIAPHDLGKALLITTAARGGVSFEIAGQKLGAPGGSTVLAVDADRPVFHYGAHSEVIKLQLRQERVDAVCWQLLGHKGMQPVRFGVQAIEGAAHQHWLALMNYLMRSLQTSDRSEASVFLARGLEEMLILHLLNALPHNYSSDMQREPHVLAPREYRRACTYIAEHLRDPITLTDIAQTVGCSVRSLSRAFRQAMDTTPMRHLRELRLKEVHAELGRSSEGAVTIAETALQWGFGHLGEFNYHYRQRFGESPSQTRARART